MDEMLPKPMSLDVLKCILHEMIQYYEDDCTSLFY